LGAHRISLKQVNRSTSLGSHPSAKQVRGALDARERLKEDFFGGGIPIPNDDVRAEAIEYFALLDVLESCRGGEARKGSFTFVELGASYGPGHVPSPS
jgi:hypothetical protein